MAQRILRRSPAWIGTYESRATGRGGSITFHLTDDPKGAHGDVLFVPQREFIYPRDEPHPEPFGGAAVLTIELVRVAAGEISGKIAPYPDPEMPEATLETHFAGHLDGERIEGTFVTDSDRGVAPRRGTWRVRRKPSRVTGCTTKAHVRGLPHSPPLLHRHAESLVVRNEKVHPRTERPRGANRTDIF